MALYELVLQTRYREQVMVNRWNYVLTGTPASVTGSFALVSAVGGIYDLVAVPPGYPTGTLLDAISYLMTPGAVFDQITAINVYDPLDFYQLPFVSPYAGKAAGDGLSPAMAIGYRSTQVRRDIARGTKRFTGTPEAYNQNGGVIDISDGSRPSDVAELMTEVLSYDDEGNTLSFAPCVVSKQEYDPNPDEPEENHRAYRYYPTLAAQMAETAVGIIWQPYATLRTQVSRQYGRGR